MKLPGPARSWCLLVALGASVCSRTPASSPVDGGTSDARISDTATPGRTRDGAANVESALRAPVVKTEPVGGRWVSCYANFRPTGTPEREVTRLGAACGAANGLIPLGSPAGGDALDTPDEHHLSVQAGDCFRIFAVAEASVPDLGIEIIGPWGGSVASVRSGDRWPIMNPDGPLCLFDSGIHTIRVRALSGKGRYAFQVWRLP